MINHYKLDRNDIINLIKNNQKTRDGNYWYPYFDEINEEKGKKNDCDYYYPREMFKHKMYFTDEDVELYLSKEKKDINMDAKYRKSLQFYETNKELKSLNISDLVLPNEFTVEELIDSYEYII